MKDVTDINKYKKLQHGTALELYRIGTEDLLLTIEKLDNRASLVLGVVLGCLLTALIVLLVSWCIAASTAPEVAVQHAERYRYLQDSGPDRPGHYLNEYVLV